VLAPTQARQDTLAMIYMSEGKYIQALNTIGIDHKVDDSDIAVEVKAVSLKSINEYERSIVHFEELYKRNPEVSVAYELAEVYLQTQKLDQATKYTEFGLANSKDNMGKTFYETQQPYQVPVKAAFMYLNALIKFNENKAENIDAAVAILDEALKLAPNFNFAQLSKNALLQQKPQPEKQD
jgi:tetratricopeptide (TPR) repeat protein